MHQKDQEAVADLAESDRAVALAKEGLTGSFAFTPEQLAWLDLIRDHIATSLSIEPTDFDLSPFNQRGGLGKARQLFGEQLPALLDELNSTLAA